MKRATKQRLSLANHGSTSLGLWKCWERNQKQEQQVLRVGIDSELSTADVSLAMDNHRRCNESSRRGTFLL